MNVQLALTASVQLDKQYSDELSAESSDVQASDDEDYSDDFDSGNGSGWRSWLAGDNDFAHYPFTAQNVGPHFSSAPASELECFQNFVSDDLLNEFVAATNASATIELTGKTLGRGSTWQGWADVTLRGMKAYVGVMLNMALTKKCDVKDYFSLKWSEYCPFFRDVFTRKRCQQIHWMLHA